MDITRNQKLEKKRSARTSETRSKDSIAPRISNNSYTLDDGRIVNMPPETKEVLKMDDDDPRLLKFMKEKHREWQKENPDLTQKELDRRNDELIKTHTELRKKSKY